MKSIDQIDAPYWKDKRVLVRVGFDMGKNFGAMEEFRIDAGLPTIAFLLDHGAQVLILNHNGRPEGKIVPELSNEPIAKKLASLLKRDVPLLPLDTSSFSLPLAMLENLRFDPGEEANDPTFTKRLASLGDAYVNDAFTNCHRAHASMVGIPSMLPHFAGLRLAQEISILNQVHNDPEKPLLLIIGGAKVDTKIKIIKNFWDKASDIIVGGILANTILHAQGIAIGKSVIEPEYLDQLTGISITDTRLHLPVDVRVANDFEGATGFRVAAIGKLADNEIILDVGPDSEFLFDNIIKSAKMIVWNGPIGKYEVDAFASGTRQLVNSLQKSGAKVITGGGETVEFLENNHLLNTFFFVSTGGGAMLSFLAGDPMPALDALQN